MDIAEPTQSLTKKFDASLAQADAEFCAAHLDVNHFLTIWDLYQGEFSLPAALLCVALRAAKTETAAFLLKQRVSLVADLIIPSYESKRSLNESLFSRFCTLKSSNILFIAAREPTFSKFILEPSKQFKAIDPAQELKVAKLEDILNCITSLEAEQLFDENSLLDLISSAIWLASRSYRSHDASLATQYLDFAEQLLSSYFVRFSDHKTLDELVNSILSKESPLEIFQFVARLFPQLIEADLSSDDSNVLHSGCLSQLISSLSINSKDFYLLLCKLCFELEDQKSLNYLLDQDIAITEAESDLLLQLASKHKMQDITLRLFTQSKPDPTVEQKQLIRDLPAATQNQSTTTEEDLALAQDILDLSVQELLHEHPFLARSISRLQLTASKTNLHSPLATDGSYLAYDATKVLQLFKTEQRGLSFEITHSLAHCLLLHPYLTPAKSALFWNLSLDLIAYDFTTALFPACKSADQDAFLKQVKIDVPGTLSPQKLYAALSASLTETEAEDLAHLFYVDDHSAFYAESQETRLEPTEEAGKSSTSEANSQEEQATSSSNAQSQSQQSKLKSDSQKQAEARWSDEAKALKQELSEVFSRQGSLGSNRILQTIKAEATQELDLREYIRRFVIAAEELKVDVDQFDPILYTFGLDHYGDMPLIEPLEFRNEQKIRDFAIVLDTSSSVKLEVLRNFVNVVYDILAAEETISSRAEIHIIMADAKVQSDVRISNAQDLSRWADNIKLKGGGGTDFRPAIRYVESLAQLGVFHDLRGLLYFTDGWGIYPDYAPSFECSFIFYDEDHRPDLVPAWCSQYTLHPGEFESLSVY